MKDETQAVPLLSGLADYAFELRSAQIPGQVRYEAALCILDTLGCMVGGLDDDAWRPIVAAERRRNARAEASLIGIGDRLSIEAAARVNAYIGDLFELNDLIGGHASIGVVSAMLALGESLQCPGDALVDAVLVGNEVTARVYMGYYPAKKPYTQVGMCPVSFPSAIGVAAGAARLLNLSKEQTSHAMAIAGGLASWCPSEVIFGGGGSFKPMLHGSCPAEAGLMAAWYAREGMTGPLRLLESDIGYFITAADRSFPENVLDRTTWYVGNPRRKWHASCGYTHSTIDTLIAMRERGDPVAAASRIRIEVPPYTMPGVSKTQPPTSPNVARFHLQYCGALAVHGADVIQPEHSLHFAEHLGRPEIARTLAAMEVVGNPGLTHYHQCNVSLVGDAGEVIARMEGRAPKGTPQNQLSETEVIEKFVRLAARSLGSTEAALTYARRFREAESLGDWHWLIGSFGALA